MGQIGLLFLRKEIGKPLRPCEDSRNEMPDILMCLG